METATFREGKTNMVGITVDVLQDTFDVCLQYPLIVTKLQNIDTMINRALKG